MLFAPQRGRVRVWVRQGGPPRQGEGGDVDRRQDFLSDGLGRMSIVQPGRDRACWALTLSSETRLKEDVVCDEVLSTAAWHRC
jgi:hypothetical protein